MSYPAADVSLARVSTASLERLVEGLEAGLVSAPVSKNGLIAFGVKGQLDAVVAALGGHSQAASLAVLRAVLSERSHAKRPSPELVWTGPEGASAQARDTAVVLRELFEGARKRVVLAGYSFKDAENVLRPLHEVMVQYGVETHFFVDIPQPAVQPFNEEAYGREQLATFIAANWPFPSRPPILYCDRRALRPGGGASYCSLHAKCVAIDSQCAFISSANFTLRGQDRNIETGVLIRDATFAMQLDRQWMSLIEGGFVLRLK